MTRIRLALAAQEDIVGILSWSHERFGEAARRRYEALISRAITDAAACEETDRLVRPELGDGVFLWHLGRSRRLTGSDSVKSPRHFLVCLRDEDTLVVGRVLHEAMDIERYVDSDDWS